MPLSPRAVDEVIQIHVQQQGRQRRTLPYAPLGLGVGDDSDQIHNIAWELPGEHVEQAISGHLVERIANVVDDPCGEADGYRQPFGTSQGIAPPQARPEAVRVFVKARIQDRLDDLDDRPLHNTVFNVLQLQRPVAAARSFRDLPFFLRPRPVAARANRDPYVSRLRSCFYLLFLHRASLYGSLHVSAGVDQWVLHPLDPVWADDVPQWDCVWFKPVH
jgi:hypothetical protein